MEKFLRRSVPERTWDKDEDKRAKRDLEKELKGLKVELLQVDVVTFTWQLVTFTGQIPEARRRQEGLPRQRLRRGWPRERAGMMPASRITK